MTSATLQFPFKPKDPAGDSLMPFLPVTLALEQTVIPFLALLDTGAAVNVLPYSAGVQLGAVWERQTIPVPLTGNLSASEARVLVLEATVGRFAPVRLGFAWAQTDGVPVLLGQTNFFLEFDVCFFRSRSVFEIRPKESGPLTA